MSTESVPLVRKSDGEAIEATLYPGMRPADLLLVERSWTEARNDVLRELVANEVDPTQRPQSLHWDWGEKAPILKRLEATAFGLEVEGSWEGVMLTKTASHTARLKADRGKPLVYIDFIESAPWNWKLPVVGQSGRYGGVGSTLFGVAVRQSLDEGFSGRVGLHSLPQSEGFYKEVLKMTPIGRDSNKQNLLYFELSRERAEQLMKGGV